MGRGLLLAARRQPEGAGVWHSHNQVCSRKKPGPAIVAKYHYRLFLHVQVLGADVSGMPIHRVRAETTEPQGLHDLGSRAEISPQSCVSRGFTPLPLAL